MNSIYIQIYVYKSSEPEWGSREDIMKRGKVDQEVKSDTAAALLSYCAGCHS